MNIGQSEKFKIMTHLLHREHLHTKFEIDPMNIKQKSGGDTILSTDGRQTTDDRRQTTDRQTDRQTDSQVETNIPPYNFVVRGV